MKGENGGGRGIDMGEGGKGPGRTMEVRVPAGCRFARVLEIIQNRERGFVAFGTLRGCGGGKGAADKATPWWASERAGGGTEKRRVLSSS